MQPPVKTHFQAKFWILAVLFILQITCPVHGTDLPQEEIPNAYIGSTGNEVILSMRFEDKIEKEAKVDLALEKSSGIAGNVRIQSRSDLSNDYKRVFSVTFDIAGVIKEGEIETLVFVPVTDQLLTYESNALQFKFRAVNSMGETPGSVVALPLRGDAPKKFQREDAIDYVDKNRNKITTYDRIAVFYTPDRDTDKGFMWEISHSENPGIRRYGFELDFDGGQGEASYTFRPAKRGSPGEFVALIELDKPGIYGLATCPINYNQGLLGTVGSWVPKKEASQQEGTFEITKAQLFFRGFIIEPFPFPSRPLPKGANLGGSQVTLRKSGGGRKVKLALKANWEHITILNDQLVKVDRNTYATGMLTFPETLDPGSSEMGTGKFSIQQPADIDWLVENAKTPYNNLGESVLAFKFRIGDLHAIPKAPPERDMFTGATGSKPYAIKLYDKSPEDSMTELSRGWGKLKERELVIKSDHRERHAPFGIPEQRLSAHLLSTNTVFVIPVKIEMYDKHRLSDDFNTMKFQIWGYAIYGTEDVPYSGPMPTSFDKSSTTITPTPVSPETPAPTIVTPVSNAPTPALPVSAEPTSAKLDPSDPDSINPNAPDIAGIISTWVSNAEPPINATQGAGTKYEPWGRFVGATRTAVIKATRKPDDVAGRTPEQYVWDKRDTLDSVDHCTLGEYVAAKLDNKSIDHCRGRYKPTVTDVVGMRKEQAEKKLRDMGLKTKIDLGNPAETEKESLTVEKSVPESGSTVDRGGMVTLVVHPPFVDKRTVPDLTGLTAKEVIDKIKAGGLVPEINTVKSSSADQAGKVASLDPPPGSEVVAGATVFVDVFLPFVNAGTVPDVTGLGVKQAADVVKGAGFKPAFELGVGTRDPKKDKTIERQDPEPGTEIVSGSEVKMFVHTLKADSQTIPDVVGMPIARAKTVLEEMGLSMAPELGEEDASKTGDTGRVYKQSPESGLAVTAGAAVAVWVYGEYKSPKPVAMVPPSTTKKSDNNQGSQTVFVLDRVEFTKAKTKNDLCGDDQKCRHRKYRGGAGPEEEYYSISEGEAKYQFVAFRGATKATDFKITFNFDRPPSRVALGDTLYLNSTAAATGFTTGKSLGRGFYYYIKKDGNRSANFFNKDAVRIENRELPLVGKKNQGRLTKKSVNEISIPDNVKRELIIGGRHGWDPGFSIEWVYKPSMTTNIRAQSQTIPNLVGMPIADAQTILQEMGLSMAPELGVDASRAGDVGRVYQQSPEPGSAVDEGVSVYVRVYGEYEEKKKTNIPAAGVPFVDIPLYFRGKPFDRVELWSDSQEIELLTNQMGRINRTGKGFLQDSGAFRTFNIIYYSKGDKNRYHFTMTWLEPDDPIVDTPTVNNYFCKGEKGLSVNKAYVYDHLELRMLSNNKAMLIDTTAPLKATQSELDEYSSFMNQIGEYIEPYARSCE